MKIFKLISFALLIGMALVACVPGMEAPAAPSTGEPAGHGLEVTLAQVPTDTPPTPDESEILPPAAALAAQQALAKRLNLLPEAIEIRAVEQVQWPNACLGAAAPDEICAEVITGGFRVVLAVGEKPYEYHTNMDGSQVRAFDWPAPAAGGQAELPTAATAARFALSRQLGVSILKVVVVSVEEVEWPDSCLGVAQPDVVCAQVITPGYRVILENRAQIYEFHTNADGSQVVEAQAALPAGEEVVLAWRREGGIVGFCDDLLIYADGRFEAVSCKRSMGAVPVELRLTGEQFVQLNAWIRRFASFEFEQQDPPGAADAMTIKLAFVGLGSEQPTVVQQEEMALFVQDVYISASR